MKKVCVYVGSRANYSSCVSIMKNILNHSALELQVVLGAAAVLSRFGNLEKSLERDGFPIHHKIYTILEGETPLTMSKSTGLGIVEISTCLDILKPDILLVVGDRFDVMAPVIAATYMNIRVAHTMGGEVTGTIDESIRHAITKFAHYHFPANDLAAQRIVKMGEDQKHVYQVGCPRIDLVKEVLNKNTGIQVIMEQLHSIKGVGLNLDIAKPFLLVSLHPVTTEFGCNRDYMNHLLNVLHKLKAPTVMLWPNADAGSDEISKSIRTFREKNRPEWLTLYINLPVELYINLMAHTKCLIGNSSSGIREGAYIGTPVINIGTRQNSRQRGKNVTDVDYDESRLEKLIIERLQGKRFAMEDIYGDGSAGEKIANVLAENEPPLQKILQY